MPAPLTSEQDFLARLQQGPAASGLPASGAGLFEALGSEMRCLIPDCPDPAHPALAPPTAQMAPTAIAPPRLAAHPAWSAPNLLWHALWQLWRYLREVSGDDAYERYLLHMGRFHPGQTPMTRADHFKFRQEQKWNRLTRCC